METAPDQQQSEELLATGHGGPEAPADVVSGSGAAPVVDGIQQGTAGNIERAVEAIPSREGRNRRFLKQIVLAAIVSLDDSIKVALLEYDSLLGEKKTLRSGGSLDEAYANHLRWSNWEQRLSQCQKRLDELKARKMAYQFLQDHVFSVPKDENELLTDVPRETQELFRKMKAAIDAASTHFRSNHNIYDCCMNDTLSSGEKDYSVRYKDLDEGTIRHLALLGEIFHDHYLKRSFRNHPRLQDAIAVEMLDKIVPFPSSKNAHSRMLDLQKVVGMSEFKPPENFRGMLHCLHDFYYAS